MSNAKGKQHILGKKQLSILRFLAEKGPHNINATNSELFSLSHYHATHTAFKALEQKGLIQKSDSKKTGKSPLSWLTFEGIMLCLSEGIMPKCEYIKTVLSDESEIEASMLMIDLVRILGSKFPKMMLQILGSKKKVEAADILYLYGQTKPTNGQLREMAKAIKKYPSSDRLLREAWNETKRRVKQYDEVVSHE